MRSEIGLLRSKLVGAGECRKKLHEQIGEAIQVHEKVLLILSADSMSSERVKTEIAKARKREVREKRKADSPRATRSDAQRSSLRSE